MMRKKIMVPFGPGGGDLKSVHHALALAERLDALVLIVQWEGRTGSRASSTKWVDDALADVIANARLAGLNVSHMTVSGPAEEDEIANLVDEEGVDLLVLNADRWQLESALLRCHPRLTGNIIRVKEKVTMNVAEEEGDRRWQS